MKIAIFGAGYVGLVTGACFSEMGNTVTIIDTQKERIEQLNKGISPVHEPDLSPLLKKNHTKGTLFFSSKAKRAIEESEIIFIAVGTPPNKDGTVDLAYVSAVADTIGTYLNEYKVIAIKSTVPIGTAHHVTKIIQKSLLTRKKKTQFDVVSNPEFLKEGSAVNDCMKPDRIIIGSDSQRTLPIMKALYTPFNRNHDRLIQMSTRSSEMCKYVANAMLATKISFMNEMSQIAESVGANIEDIRVGIGADQRIGYHFIYPGCGYGGSCFPKDVRALISIAKENNFHPQILDAVHQVNERQKQVLFQKIKKFYNGKLKGKIFSIWGLSFKPNTDDIREAPSCALLEALWKEGAMVRAYDPAGVHNIKKMYGANRQLQLCASKEEALKGSNALAILTEWSEFRSPNFNELKEKISDKVIFDGRNLYNPALLKKLGIIYFSIGRA